jgi:hypothetical protein
MNATQQLDLIDQTLAGPYGALPLTDYLRRNGRRWSGSALPPGVKKGPQRQCFRIAWQMSLSLGLNLYPSSGRVIDATWAIGKGAVYLGIELSPKQLMRIINLTECFGVLQNGRAEDLELVVHVLALQPIPAE